MELSQWRDFEIFQFCVLTVPVQNNFHSSVFISGKHLVSETLNANNRLFSSGGVAMGHAGGSPRSLREQRVDVGTGPRLFLDVAQWLKSNKVSHGPPPDPQNLFSP